MEYYYDAIHFAQLVHRRKQNKSIWKFVPSQVIIKEKYKGISDLKITKACDWTKFSAKTYDCVCDWLKFLMEDCDWLAFSMKTYKWSKYEGV